MRKEEDFIVYRGRRKDEGSQAAFASYGAPSILGEADVRQEPRGSASRNRVLVLAPLAEYPAPEILKCLEHAYSLKEELDPTWSARPIGIARHWDRSVLVLEDPGGAPLDQSLSQPVDLAFWLRVAIGLSTAIGHLHQRGIIHKDIKPANILVNPVTGQCWLTGLLVASRLRRERQGADTPAMIFRRLTPHAAIE